MKRMISIVILLSLVACEPVTTNQKTLPQTDENTNYHKIKSCSNDSDYNWKNTTLADYVKHCSPEGWDGFFNKNKIKQQINLISKAFQLQLDNHQVEDINPKLTWVFRAMNKVRPENIRAVIMGQDPAPQRNQATGLAFSLKKGTPSNTTPSVQRVMLEAQNEGACVDLSNGSLMKWAEEGVFLWNAAPTIPCKQGKALCEIAGHLKWWVEFTDELVLHIDEMKQPMTFILWGGKAKAYESKIKNPLHLIIDGVHPSPRNKSGRYFCQSYFTATNSWLKKSGTIDLINWNLKHSSCSIEKACVWKWINKDSDGNYLKTPYSVCERECSVE